MPDISNVALKKTVSIRDLIQDGVRIIGSVGVPMDDLTPRRLEKMSMCLLALTGISETGRWHSALSIDENRTLRTREIITFINQNFEENISSGSYDDIRRKDLIRLVGMGLVVKSANNPGADTNDGTRGYAVSRNFVDLIKSYNSTEWASKLDSFEIDQNYIDEFTANRKKEKLSVTVADDVQIFLDDGPHNQIQKAVVESFLPLYGYNAQVLYIGDTSEKRMHKYSQKMMELGLDIEDRGMLPDIVAFSEDKEWIYLIEAVHSSNPLNPERCIELKRTVLKNCPYGVVFVTAFLSKKDFSKWMPQIAWETEVWLVDTPEHLIHFNGDKFIGPHNSDPTLE